MPRQDIVKVELVEESVKIPRQGYSAGSDTEHTDRFHHSIELHIGSISVFLANDMDPVLLAQTIQMLKEPRHASRYQLGVCHLHRMRPY